MARTPAVEGVAARRMGVEQISNHCCCAAQDCIPGLSRGGSVRIMAGLL
jgi:hypothetical protein